MGRGRGAGEMREREGETNRQKKERKEKGNAATTAMKSKHVFIIKTSPLKTAYL